jgi:hypothetical protein
LRIKEDEDMQRARVFLSLLGAGLAVAAFAPQASATPAANEGPAVLASGPSPIVGCDGDQPTSGTNFPNSEVEPWMAVNPANPSNLLAAWQQDRWNNGGSEGLVTASSFNGGLTWTTNANTKSSFCTGGSPANGGLYERASDPWVDFSPNGTAYLMSLSVDTNAGGIGIHPNSMLVMRSTTGGRSWSDPIPLIRDENPNVLNDKNSLTADPNDSSFVYAVWDRLAPPAEIAPTIAFENAVASRGPTWFARTTNGGTSWEAARLIYEPGTLNQTIGNQIVVLPDNDQFDGQLVDFFDLIHFSNKPPGRDFSIALVRSDDHGATWDKRATVVDRHNTFQGLVVDPDDPNPSTRLVRTGDIIPQGTVDPNTGAIYLVFQDMRFGGVRSSIAFTQSLDGGRTWSRTIKINKTPTDIALGNQQAFNPVVSVLEDGTIGVRYSDFRANQDTPAVGVLATDEFLIHCHPTTPTACTDPANWGDEVKQTDTSYNIRQMPFARGWFPGDYVGMDTDGADWLPFWAQPSGGDPANDFVRRVGLITPVP